MAGSIGRTDRTGPISGGTVSWKTATNRVMPPSTTSSHTTSAAPSPVCGRASIEFSILTASAGRSTGPCAGTPVRGQSTGGGGGGGVVVGAAALVLLVLLVRD